jgi:hypothetical protein
MEKCEQCDVEMIRIEFGEPEIGAMGTPVTYSYYKCSNCGRTKPSYDAAADLLAQHIDKDILDELTQE